MFLRVMCGVLLLLVFPLQSTETTEREVKVGRQHKLYHDPSRLAWDGVQPRPLAATIWYPAQPDVQEALWQAGVFEFGYSAADAPVLHEQKMPLILLSHGTGGSAAQLSWLAEGLVQYGFLVAALSHHGNTAAEEKSFPHGFVLPWERAKDLSVLLDMLADDPQFAPLIDSERIGAAGFSLGGYTVLAAGGAYLDAGYWQSRCQQIPDNPSCQLPPEAGFTQETIAKLAASDPLYKASIERSQDIRGDKRIKAVFAIAPALLNMLDKTSLAAYTVPVTVRLGMADEQVRYPEVSAFLFQHFPKAALLPLPDVRHYSFLAPCNAKGRQHVKELCGEEPGMDRQQVHRQMVFDVASFFGSYLQVSESEMAIKE